MKSVLISIRPQWCEKIASGEKTIEVRKTAPKFERPFKCYIYMSQGELKDLGSYSEWIYKNRMKVIGEFICDKVDEYFYTRITGFSTLRGYFISDNHLAEMCLSYGDVMNYGKGKTLYGWHISDLKIYDKPKELSEFRKPFIDYVSPKESIMVNPKIGISEYVTCPPQSWIFVEEQNE